MTSAPAHAGIPPRAAIGPRSAARARAIASGFGSIPSTCTAGTPAAIAVAATENGSAPVAHATHSARNERGAASRSRARRSSKLAG